MDQHDDRSSRIQHESELASNLDYVLSHSWMEWIQIAIIREKKDPHVIKSLLDHFPSDCDESSIATGSLHLLMEYSLADRTDSEIECYRQILRDLAAKGADLDQKNDREMTAVQVAVAKKNVHAVVWFSEIGAKFNVLTSEARNLLHLLVIPHGYQDENAEEAIFDVLVGKGCDVNARDSNGATPLHLAAEYRNKTMARKLIERGADVNGRDKDMQIPLHYAGIKDMAHEIIEFLLENGANANAKDSRGDSLLSRAVAGMRLCGTQVKVLRSLLKWGAQVNSLLKFDENKIRRLARMMDVGMFREFLEYGLDVDNSPSCNYLYRHGGVETLMEQHCIKLKAAELHCSEDYSSRSKDKQKCQDYYEECLKEVETLKATFIGSHTSLYDFLRMSRACKCLYISNEKMKSLVYSQNLKTQFPLYSTIILASYRDAVARKFLPEK